MSTVGVNEATIKNYIEDQDKHDTAMEKLSVKEHSEPFKGELRLLTSHVVRQKWQRRSGLSIVRASVLRRWSLSSPYRASPFHPFFGWLGFVLLFYSSIGSSLSTGSLLAITILFKCSL